MNRHAHSHLLLAFLSGSLLVGLIGCTIAGTNRQATPIGSAAPIAPTLPALTATAQARNVAPAVQPVETLTVLAPQIYTDPELGFQLKYNASWYLGARTGAALNDGSGRTIVLTKQGYQSRMMVQNRQVVGECAGSLEKDSATLYWKYSVDGRQVWRAKAEAGFVNSYNDDKTAFIDIISPVSLPNAPASNGNVGKYTCSLEMHSKILSISYVLPVSVADLKAGRFMANVLAEMDYALTSIKWER